MAFDKDLFVKVNNLRIKMSNGYTRLRELTKNPELTLKIQANIRGWIEEHNELLKE